MAGDGSGTSGLRKKDSFRRQVHGSLDERALIRAASCADRRVDALGAFCPEPVIRIQEAAREAPAGAVLLLLADDAGVEIDIPAWCMSHGHEYLGLLRGDSDLQVLVRINRSGR